MHGPLSPLDIETVHRSHVPNQLQYCTGFCNLYFSFHFLIPHAANNRVVYRWNGALCLTLSLDGQICLVLCSPRNGLHLKDLHLYVTVSSNYLGVNVGSLDQN